MAKRKKQLTRPLPCGCWYDIMNRKWHRCKTGHELFSRWWNNLQSIQLRMAFDAHYSDYSIKPKS